MTGVQTCALPISAIVIPDGGLTAAGLREAIDRVLGDAERRAGMEVAMRGLARPDAAREMADVLLDLAGRR